jgi:hypothetical protein
MNINSDENPFFMNDIDNHSNQNPLMEIIKNLYKQGQFDFDFNFLNNFPTIELEEDKEEERRKRDKLFMKSFKEVFGLNDNDFIDAEIDKDEDEEEDDIYFNKKIKKDRKKGRPKKGEIRDYEVKKDKFDKFLTLHKIIRCLFKNALNHINKTYEATNAEKKSGPLLRSVDAEEYNVYSNQKIVELFNKTLGDVFSAKISRRNFNFISEHSEDNNKIVIESLKKENKEKADKYDFKILKDIINDKHIRKKVKSNFRFMKYISEKNFYNFLEEYNSKNISESLTNDKEKSKNNFENFDNNNNNFFLLVYFLLGINYINKSQINLSENDLLSLIPTFMKLHQPKIIKKKQRIFKKGKSKKAKINNENNDKTGRNIIRINLEELFNPELKNEKTINLIEDNEI